jgi:hypothetical protein
MTGDSLLFSVNSIHDSGVAFPNRTGVLDTLKFLCYVKVVRNRTLTLIEREDDTRS